MILMILVCAVPFAFAQDVPSVACSTPDVTDVPTARVWCVVDHPSTAVISVCWREACKNVFVDGQTRVPVDVVALAPGEHEYVIEARGPQAYASVPVLITYSIVPSIELESLDVPARARYGEEFTFTAILASVTRAQARDVRVYLRGQEVHQTDVLAREELNMTMNSRLLYKPLTLDVTYKDAEGMEYSVSWDVPVELVDVSVPQRLSLFFRRVFSIVTD